MAPFLNRSSMSFENIGALSQLVEAASTLTELEVKEPVTEKSPSTVLVSDDDDTSRITAKVVETTTVQTTLRRKEIFPQKLMEILADSSLTEIVSWLPHGRSFVILRPDLFCEEVLPRYLPPADSRGSTKYPSFTRKLNRWGFRQATRGADSGAFHHPFFLREQPELCMKMVCQKSRDRQQGPQKHRSLPPKKRSIPESNAPPYSDSHQVLPLIIASVDKHSSASVSSNYPPTRVAAPMSVDDRSIQHLPNTSRKTSGNVITVNNNSDLMTASSASIPLVAINERTRSTDSSKSSGSSGVIPFISNDSKFVASTLKQRESLEIYRAAKAMLYDAYMKAVNDETR